jgi:hypothetical protein
MQAHKGTVISSTAACICAVPFSQSPRPLLARGNGGAAGASAPGLIRWPRTAGGRPEGHHAAAVPAREPWVRLAMGDTVILAENDSNDSKISV